MASGKYWVTAPDAIFPIENRMGAEGVAARKPQTVPELFKSRVEMTPNADAMKEKIDGKWVTTSWKDYHDACTQFAKACMHSGLKQFQSVSVLGFNSSEWFISDCGAILAAGMACGVYATNGPQAVQYIVEHSDSVVCVVEDGKQLAKILEVQSQCPLLKTIVQYKGDVAANQKADNVYNWADFLKLGDNVTQEALEERQKLIVAGHCSTLIYTSGTTGNPKAVMISHDNCTWTARVTCEHLSLNNEHIISYLPLSHIAAQMVDIMAPMVHGGCTWFAQPDALKGSLGGTMQEVRPTFFFGVPRVWEKIQEKMQALGAQTTGLKKIIATWAKEQGLAAYYAEQAHTGRPWLFGIAQHVVLDKIRMALGLDRCRNFLTGAAPITKECLEYFGSVYIPINELYGMSECTGPQTVSKPDQYKIGSCGPCIAGTELVIYQPDAEGNGEICYRGRHVMMGYMKNPDATRETIDEDGLLHSGDVGKMVDGMLYITGRIKELIITAGGENIPPVLIENAIKKHVPALANVMVIGDKRKFLSCVVTLRTKPNADGTFSSELEGAAKAVDPACKTVEEAQKSAVWKKMIEDGIKSYNAEAISAAQKVQKFEILPTDFSIPGNELTPTLKLKRRIVVQKYDAIIESMYA